MTRRSIAALALAVLAGQACRSASPAASPAAPQGPPPAFITGYVGQGLILRNFGTHQRLTLTRQDVQRVGGECDVGVQVREASFAGGTASFTLDAGESRDFTWTLSVSAEAATFGVTPEAVPVPAPAPAPLLAAGLFGLALSLRRRGSP